MAEEGLHCALCHGNANSVVLGLLGLLLVYDQEEGECGVVWETSPVSKICPAIGIRNGRPLCTDGHYAYCLHAL